MAELARRRGENVAGTFFVDDTCIDCDTCRWMAPETFADIGDQSAVHHQPTTDAARFEAALALVACPTASIGVTADDPAAKRAVADAAKAFPVPLTDGVSHCGYHSESSFGAASYFIQREGGNVLVDSPRFAGPLVKRLEALGGVRYLYLTHRDDVADHARFAEHFGCERVLHKDDVTSGTRDVEVQPEGTDWFELENDLEILPVPGHTKGHTVLLHKDVLFTGDHMAWSERRGHLVAFRGACWYSWGALRKSMRGLVDVPFRWVLPGHGRRHHAEVDHMQASLARCLEWMDEVA